jgi:hypothetical protein
VTLLYRRQWPRARRVDDAPPSGVVMRSLTDRLTR